MDVSIIIVNYNTINLIVDSIDSIFEKTKNISFEILVVDNNSSDNSRARLEEKYNENVIYISLSENIGFGRANNEGIKVAKGRNIFLLNPDTILINNAIKVLSDFLDTDVSTGACGGNLFDEKMMPTHSFRRRFPSIFSEINDLLYQIPEKLIYGKNKEFNHTGKIMNVSYITGADLMLKKTIIEELGSFNPLFFMYYEETELCFRISKAGYKIKSVPTAMIQHLEGKSFSQGMINEKKILLIEKGKNIFYKITYSKQYIRINQIIFQLNAYFRLSISRIVNKNKYEYWKLRYRIFKSEKQH